MLLPMNYLRVLICLLLIAATACQCSALRTQTAQLRVARVRRLEEAGE